MFVFYLHLGIDLHQSLTPSYNDTQCSRRGGAWTAVWTDFETLLIYFYYM